MCGGVSLRKLPAKWVLLSWVQHFSLEHICRYDEWIARQECSVSLVWGRKQSSICGWSRTEGQHSVNPWLHNHSTFWLVLLWNRLPKQITGHFCFSLKMKASGTQDWDCLLWDVLCKLQCVLNAWTGVNLHGKRVCVPKSNKYLVFFKLQNAWFEPYVISFLLENSVQDSKASRAV